MVKSLEQHATEVAEDLTEVRVEASRCCAVDDAVVPRQSSEATSGEAQTALPSHTGSMVLLHTPRMATSGALMMGVKYLPPMPPRLEMVKVAPVISAGLSLPSRAFLANSAISCADLQHAFFVAIADDRHHQTIGRVSGKADVPVVFVDQCIAVE
jgi:hypothetical protein